MQYCPKCKVNIRGEKYCCPLCQGKIKEIDDNIDEPFPTLPHCSIKVLSKSSPIPKE